MFKKLIALSLSVIFLFSASTVLAENSTAKEENNGIVSENKQDGNSYEAYMKNTLLLKTLIRL